MHEEDPLPEALRNELNAALDEYQAAMAQERGYTDRIAELETVVAGG